MNKQNIFTLLIISVCLLGVIVIKRSLTHKTTQWHVGILQTATHPALNAVRDSFIQELQHSLGDTVTITVQNAEGSVSNMQTMAQSLHSNNTIDLLFGIATPAAQALVSVKKQKPILFAAVTDPIAGGLYKGDTGNVTGVTDMIDTRKQIELLRLLLPQAQTVALIFNRGEINSVTLAQQMKEHLKALNINTVEFGVMNESEIPAAVEAACRKADLILTPTDNTVASTIKIIISIAQSMNKPVIVSDAMLVQQGALAAQGIDYAQCGTQAAQLATTMLRDGKKPIDLPFIQPDSKAVINKDTFDTLQIALPIQNKIHYEFISSKGV